jgi:hypothetical protein
MCASPNTTAALLECPVFCQTFLVRSPAVTHRAVCTHCGAHQLMRHETVQEPAPPDAGKSRETVALGLPAAMRDRSALARR